MSSSKTIELKEFRGLARSMYFSNPVIDEFYASATPSQIQAVVSLIGNEREQRLLKRKERLFRKAKFPQIKSFEGYDFSQVVFPEGFSVEELKSLAFISSQQDFVFHGKTGRGKTHLAIALGVAAVDAGFEVRFFTAAQLVMLLKKAQTDSTLDSFLKDLSKANLIILDELGYVPFDIEGARLLFQVMSDCYEKRSLVITTNIEFGKWGTVFGDDKLAAALIDRIVHHGRFIEFNGVSHRMSAALMLQDNG